MMDVKRKLTVAAALVALGAGVLVASATAAQASTPVCDDPEYSLVQDGGSLVASAYKFCSGVRYSQSVLLQRANGDGSYTNLVSGIGQVVYACPGTATTTYRATMNGSARRSLTANCG
ncbi:hypothetical protein R8Z50_18690 [Longispora sp. K20-0274]|uniref:hypothetical protein n=1 Tax=Longispora sp. K20-0274 TaxID=3088255 RepID=UPI0039998418